MSSAETPEFIPVDAYLAAEELAATKREYIDGWVRAMSDATLRHNRVVLNCLVSLANQLKGQPCQPFNSDTKVCINREDRKRFYYPDVQVVCESNAPTSVFQDHPVLIIEVLSPSTRPSTCRFSMANCPCATFTTASNSRPIVSKSLNSNTNCISGL